jgi:RecQ family ATP-dependent DNA helicase
VSTKTKEPEIVIPPRASSIPFDAVQQMMEGLKRLPQVLNGLGFDALRPGQDKAVKSIMSQQDTVVILPTATGKCFSRGTLILMFDGSVKKVEDVEVGDMVMGADSSGRKVVATHRGRDAMFRVTPKKGEPYVVNSQHILSLRITGMRKRVRKATGETYTERVKCGGKSYTTGEVANVSVVDYMSSNKTFKHCAKGWKTGVDLPSRPLPPQLPPYMLGLWLGDGSVGKTDITKPDPEVEASVRDYVRECLPDHTVREYVNASGCPSFRVVSPEDSMKGRGHKSNAMLNALRDVGVLHDKHIPRDYLWNDRSTRLELLAGILDADGYLAGKAYDITLKHRKLSEDLVFLVRSLGLHATMEPCVKSCQTGAAGDYFRIYISGKVKSIPLRIPRRQSDAEPAREVLHSGITVTPCGEDDYYGFEVGGKDSLFLLADFTVVHNSAVFVVPTLCMQWRAIIIYPLVALMRDQATSMQRKGLSAASISSQESDAHNAAVLRDWASGELQFMLVSPERFANEEWANVVAQFPPDIIAMDECHTFHDWADTFRHGYKVCGQFIQKMQPKVVTALSATLSEEAEKEVRGGLGIQDAKLIYHYPRRENLVLQSLFLDRIAQAPAWVVDNCQGPTIVYSSTRKRTEEYASDIGRYTDRPVFFYHGGMQQKDRKYSQDKFMADPDAIIVATNAFGMGVDKPDIRNVVHFDIPGNLVACAQEIGRAGRDGKDSHCTIIPTAEGLRTRRHFIRCGNPTPKDIKDFFKAAAAMREGRNGAITAKRDEIAHKAGIDLFAVQAIMTFCLGEGIFYHDTNAARQQRLRFAEVIPSMTAMEMETRDAIYDVALEKDGWWEFDIEALAEQCAREVETVMGRLRKLHDKGYIEWVRASTSRPLQIARTPDEVPKESFDRLAEKAARAESDLQLVMDYAETADDEKHNFLEAHLNR